jgi:hypothetical protein
MELSIELQPTADSQQFSLDISHLASGIFGAAAANIDATINQEDYTSLERQAMIAAEALRLTHGMDLAAILMRGQIIREIEVKGLIAVHPNGYADLTALAAEQGISIGELSDTRALCEVIFPFIERRLGRNLAEVWSTIGKAKLRELVPALRSMITGENASHRSVRTAVTTMLSTAASALRQEGLITEETGDEEIDSLIRRRAVEDLMEHGATLTSRELRRTVRPSRTAPLEVVTLKSDEDQWYAVVKIDGADQLTMMGRLLGQHHNNMVMDGRGNERLMTTLSRMFPGE